MIPQVAFSIFALASWYGEAYRGKPMANGQPFDPAALTCAIDGYAFGTQLRIYCPATERAVTVTVTDRPGPACRRYGRIIDLSVAAFTALAHPDLGMIKVRYSVLTNLPAAVESQAVPQGWVPGLLEVGRSGVAFVRIKPSPITP